MGRGDWKKARRGGWDKEARERRGGGRSDKVQRKGKKGREMGKIGRQNERRYSKGFC